MPATVLLVTFTIALVIVLGGAIWAVCLLAGAARPIRRHLGPSENLRSIRFPGTRLSGDPRPEGGAAGREFPPNRRPPAIGSLTLAGIILPCVTIGRT